ncbi:MAG: hypothetical protein J6T70_15475, partial [Bacteroidales bacterium]|nr:hypothetical protein [Bacteroidales bacterium]
TENFKIHPSAWKQKAEDRKKEKKLKELYTRYNQCRDAELDRFWKNSVFVWCFLLLCFTAFGMTVKDYNMPNRNSVPPTVDDYYLFLSIISGLGVIISFIWVWMAKGLKAWYEVYENAIWEIEVCKNEFGYPRNYTLDNFWAIKEDSESFKNWLIGTKPISPSKIVIAIGLILVSIWGVAFLYSLCRFIAYKTCHSYFCQCCDFPYMKIIFPVVCVAIFFAIKEMRKWINSSSLRNKEENELFTKIKNDVFIKNMDLYFEVKNGKVLFYFYGKKRYIRCKHKVQKYFGNSGFDVEKNEHVITFDVDYIKDFFEKKGENKL